MKLARAGIRVSRADSGRVSKTQIQAGVGWVSNGITLKRGVLSARNVAVLKRATILKSYNKFCVYVARENTFTINDIIILSS